jgi:hypothetical protein
MTCIAPCTFTKDCPNSACVPETGECIGCVSDETCGGLYCDVPSGLCAECLVDEHCPPDKPRCYQGLGPEGGTLWSGTCVECFDHGDCPAGLPVCDSLQLRCEPSCVVDEDCDGLEGFQNLCIDGHCDECYSDADCTSTTWSHCNTFHRCVECQTDAQCGGSKPVCEGSTCRACIPHGAC